MRPELSHSLKLAALCGSLCFASFAAADTIATFADPAADASTPVFAFEGSTLTGQWNDAGLTLATPITEQVFENVSFSMTPLTVSGNAVSAGTIRFFESAAEGGDLILRIDFDGGTFSEFLGLGASFSAGNAVTFSGPVVSSSLEEGEFAFSFNNATSTSNGTAYTAAFTSSATPVSDPNDGGGTDGGGTDGGGTDGGGTDGGGTDGGGTDGGGTDGGGTEGDGTGDGDDMAPACGLLACGGGMMPMVPLMVIGLAAMKVGYGRGRSRANGK